MFDTACVCVTTIYRGSVFLYSIFVLFWEKKGALKWKSLLVMSKDKWYSIIHYSKHMAVGHQRAHFDALPLKLYGFLNVKLNCAITLEINQSWIPSFLEWSPHTEISACLCGRLLHFVWDVALLCLRPHTSVDISLKSKEQHDTGRVTLGLLFMGRNKAITASRLVVFGRSRFITRTTLARDESSYAYLCVFSLSLPAWCQQRHKNLLNAHVLWPRKAEELLYPAQSDTFLNHNKECRTLCFLYCRPTNVKKSKITRRAMYI
jgi:hypothetical protein